MHLTDSTIIRLLYHTIDLLNRIPNEILRTKQGVEFESILAEKINDSVDQIGFTNVSKVELVSGHRYPDIVIHTETTKLGVEVKTSRSKGWTTLGGSIFESTRVEGVNSIMLFFANFHDLDNIQYRFDWMENCVSDVVITHKPRYAINMDIDKTFFDLSGVTYEDLQNSNRPFLLIREFLKNRNSQHADLWWVDDSEDGDLSNIGPQSIRAYSSLSQQEKSEIVYELYVLFPELFSGIPDKYIRASLFLTAKKGVFHHAFRDIFSAGGKYIHKGCEAPKYLKAILNEDDRGHILSKIDSISVEYIEEYWNDYSDNFSRKAIWSREVIYNIQKNEKISDYLKEDIINWLNYNNK